MVVADQREAAATFFGAFVDDPFSRFMKALALIGSLVTLLLSIDFMRNEKIGGFEFPVLILLATLGMMMLISAGDFIALYLGLELMSLSLYVIAAYRRDDLRASEAGLKYFVLGALSSGMLLYGASLVYGYAGTVSFAGDRRGAARPRAASASSSASSSSSPASRSRSRRCRSTCGRPTSTKARRRR